MATALKDLYTEDVPREIARAVAAAWPALDGPAFLADALAGFTGLELTARARHVAAALRTHLPPDIPRALEVLTRSLGPVYPADEILGAGMAPFLYLPHVYFVGSYGLEHPDASLDFQEALTQRLSAEFSIRAFLERWPEKTWARLERWSNHDSAHVRRLVSEGTRPLLPWAPRVRALTDEPGRAVALLERLKDDPSPMVRRSVANHLNDVSRAHPELVLELCERWSGHAPEQRRALVRHALRTLVKRGNRRALEVLGVSTGVRLEVTAAGVKPARVRVGQAVEITLCVRNPSRRELTAVVDLRVHFVKPSGKRSLKVFKLKEARLAAGASLELARTLKLINLSTRTLAPGRHVVEVQVNGAVHPVGAFTLAA